VSFFLLTISSIVSYQIYKKKILADFTFLKLSLPILFICYLVTIVISFNQSIVISESAYILSKTLIGVLFFIVTTYLLIQRKITLEVIIKSIIVFTFIVSLIGIIQFIFSNGDINTINSTIANKNLLSSLLFLTFPFIFNSYLTSKKWKITALIIGIIMLLLLWIVQTKAIIISSFIFFSILLFTRFVIYRKNISGRDFTKRILFIALPLIIAAP
jgi:hypothetical protein